MTTFSRLVAAAALISATTLAPGPARADDRDEREERGERGPPCDGGVRSDRGGRDDRGEGRERGEWSDRRGYDVRYAPPPAAPGWVVRDDPRWGERGRLDGRWERHGRGERFMLVRAVRHELFELEQGRADFYARNAYRPWRLARFDAGYFERRAELERRLERLTVVAWR